MEISLHKVNVICKYKAYQSVFSLEIANTYISLYFNFCIKDIIGMLVATQAIGSNLLLCGLT